MLGHHFYFGLIRKYVVIFGTLFNDIKIVREDTVNNTSHTIEVPIAYGPREKVLARLEQDPNLDRQPAIILPRMAFELTDFQYDGSRKLPATNRRAVQGDDTDVKFQYTPVPYDLSFTLSIMAKNIDDGWRIVEQILPFFTPEFTVKATLINEMDEVRDIPIVLSSTRLTDFYEGNFEERRVITADLGFTMKAMLFGPIRTSNNIITLVNTQFFSVSSTVEESIGNLEYTDKVVWTPGQLANGSPTTNSALTIDRSLIAANSDWDYVKTSNTSL